ncbi:hypothetical protein CHS0354_035338 [Potamilus streckersoni]|uniref:Uncharacterized protein n=1 Tax=Potamilus streckersoni TaxID=2493646 RepID=A0AAE0S2L6_9BIVA|nr:hypothetical protein CHS0354_035338 [Potamilus streckersoni]
MDTPLTIFCKMNVHKFSPKELEIYHELANHNHSLFEFIKVTDKETVIYDLFKRKKLHIPDVHMLFGFEKGCYFETRVFSIEGKPVFAPFFTTHPFKANKAIWKQAYCAYAINSLDRRYHFTHQRRSRPTERSEILAWAERAKHRRQYLSPNFFWQKDISRLY